MSQAAGNGEHARHPVWLVLALVAIAVVAGFRLGPLHSGSRPAKAILAASSSSNGNGNTSDPKSFSLSGSVTGLYPGATTNLSVVVTNQNNQDIKVNAIHISVTGTDRSGCAANNVTPTDYSGPGFVVSKSSTQTIYLPITLSKSAPNACQGATFTLQYSGTAVKP